MLELELDLRRPPFPAEAGSDPNLPGGSSGMGSRELSRSRSSEELKLGDRLHRLGDGNVLEEPLAARCLETVSLLESFLSGGGTAAAGMTAGAEEEEGLSLL